MELKAGNAFCKHGVEHGVGFNPNAFTACADTASAPPVRGEMAILGMVCFGGAAFDSAQSFTAQGAGAGADPEPDSAFRAGGRYRRTDFGGAACRWGRAGADFSSCGVYAGDDHAIGGNDLAGRRGLVFAVAGGLLSVFCPAGAPVEPTGKG